FFRCLREGSRNEAGRHVARKRYGSAKRSAHRRQTGALEETPSVGIRNAAEDKPVCPFGIVLVEFVNPALCLAHDRFSSLFSLVCSSVATCRETNGWPLPGEL